MDLSEEQLKSARAAVMQISYVYHRIHPGASNWNILDAKKWSKEDRAFVSEVMEDMVEDGLLEKDEVQGYRISEKGLHCLVMEELE